MNTENSNFSNLDFFNTMTVKLLIQKYDSSDDSTSIICDLIRNIPLNKHPKLSKIFVKLTKLNLNEITILTTDKTRRIRFIASVLIYDYILYSIKNNNYNHINDLYKATFLKRYKDVDPCIRSVSYGFIIDFMKNKSRNLKILEDKHKYFINLGLTDKSDMVRKTVLSKLRESDLEINVGLIKEICKYDKNNNIRVEAGLLLLEKYINEMNKENKIKGVNVMESEDTIMNNNIEKENIINIEEENVINIEEENTINIEEENNKRKKLKTEDLDYKFTKSDLFDILVHCEDIFITQQTENNSNIEKENKENKRKSNNVIETLLKRIFIKLLKSEKEIHELYKNCKKYFIFTEIDKTFACNCEEACFIEIFLIKKIELNISNLYEIYKNNLQKISSIIKLCIYANIDNIEKFIEFIEKVHKRIQNIYEVEKRNNKSSENTINNENNKSSENTINNGNNKSSESSENNNINSYKVEFDIIDSFYKYLKTIENDYSTFVKNLIHQDCDNEILKYFIIRYFDISMFVNNHDYLETWIYKGLWDIINEKDTVSCLQTRIILDKKEVFNLFIFIINKLKSFPGVSSITEEYVSGDTKYEKLKVLYKSIYSVISNLVDDKQMIGYLIKLNDECILKDKIYIIYKHVESVELFDFYYKSSKNKKDLIEGYFDWLSMLDGKIPEIIIEIGRIINNKYRNHEEGFYLRQYKRFMGNINVYEVLEIFTSKLNINECIVLEDMCKESKLKEVLQKRIHKNREMQDEVTYL